MPNIVVIDLKRDRWIGIGLSCAPMDEADRHAVERSVRSLYRRCNLAEPKAVVFVSSPFVLRVASGIAAGALHAEIDEDVVDFELGADFIDYAFETAISRAVDAAVGDAVRAAVVRPASAVVDAAVGSAVGSAIDLVVGAIDDDATGALSTVGPAIGRAVGLAIRSAVSDRKVGLVVRAAVESALSAAIGSPPPTTADADMNRLLDDESFLLECVADVSGDLQHNGNLAVGGSAWCSFFRDVFGLELAEWESFADQEVLGSRCGPYVLHPLFAMVSDRPAALARDDGGRLHAADGPAISWRDGYGLHFWHGVHLPAWIIEQPERITLAAIDAEPDDEISVACPRLSAFVHGRHDTGLEFLFGREQPRGSGGEISSE
jgi:hypothetical protein